MSALKTAATRSLRAAVVIAVLPSCGDHARLSESAGFGRHPELPVADPPFIPTLNVAAARAWPAASPVPAAWLEVTHFATKLDHPRWMYVLPNGDVLVAETNAPSTQKCHSGFKAWVENLVLKWSGAAGRSADRISLLRDAEKNGIGKERHVFLSGLNSPFGMALVGSDLYVANTDAVLRFRYVPGQTVIESPPETVAKLAADDGNCHWTRNIIASRDGTRLYVTVGSNSDHGERGKAIEQYGQPQQRAAIHELDLATRRMRVFASGLRNPNGLDFEPLSGALWTTVNERDELGSDLVPDYMTAVTEGASYGWPCWYFGLHADARVPAEWNCAENANVRVPDYALGAHTASFGIAFARGNLLPQVFAQGAFVAQHGSWNRRPLAGYKVIFIPFRSGVPAGDPVDVLTGFVDGEGYARGRPVGVAIDRGGALLVSDDVANTIWRLAPSANTSKAADTRR